MANPADRAAPWVDLPRDLTANILQRLRVVDIFKSALVCTAWRRLCQDPSMWRYLHLRNVLADEPGFSKAVNEFPLLEELQVEYSAISKQGIEAAGRSCPFLNSFSFIKASQYNGSSDEEAVAIAENMHGLKHLTLVGNDMSDKGVEAILDGCPSLQSLYIADCISVGLEGELGKRCSQQIKDLNHIPQPRTRFFF
nr:putative F-box/LRR-repeat protein 23 [Ipomoea batatas]